MIAIYNNLDEVINTVPKHILTLELRRLYIAYEVGDPNYFDSNLDLLTSLNALIEYYKSFGNDLFWYSSNGKLQYSWNDNLEPDLFSLICKTLSLPDKFA